MFVPFTLHTAPCPAHCCLLSGCPGRVFSAHAVRPSLLLQMRAVDFQSSWPTVRTLREHIHFIRSIGIFGELSTPQLAILCALLRPRKFAYKTVVSTAHDRVPVCWTCGQLGAYAQRATTPTQPYLAPVFTWPHPCLPLHALLQVLREGQIADSVYIIRRGQCRVSKRLLMPSFGGGTSKGRALLADMVQLSEKGVFGASISSP